MQDIRAPRLSAVALFAALALAPALDAQAPAPAPRDTVAPGPVVQAGAPRPLAADSAAAAAQDTIVFVPGPMQPGRIGTPGILGRRDLAIGAGMTAAAVALFPLDDQITAWLRAPGRQESGAWKSTMDAAEWGVETGSIAAGAGLWVTGLALRNRGIAETGIHSLTAIVVSNQVTKVLKGAFGRSRPYYSADSLAHDWDFGSGFGEKDRRSFPSGHTSHAFAFASAMSQEINHHWPRAGKVATPLLYGGATAAALARVYNDKHWASDVTIGAAVGILSSRATLGYLHGRPRNFFDRLALNTRIVPRDGGAMVAVTLPTP